MGYMKDFAIELENAGIDYRIVDLEVVEAYREAYRAKTSLVIQDGGKLQVHEGHTITLIEAAKALYC